MNNLLIFFALPIAVIIISIALQRILKSPILVAAIIFAIFLIVTFVVNNLNFLVAAIVYAIISFITAFLVYLIGKILRQLENNNGSGCRRNPNNNILTISNIENENSNCGCNQNQNIRTYEITNENGLSARVNVIPNLTNTNANTTNNNTNSCGCNRR